MATGQGWWSTAGRHNPGAASFDFRALLPLQQLSTLAVIVDHDGAVGALAGELPFVRIQVQPGYEGCQC